MRALTPPPSKTAQDAAIRGFIHSFKSSVDLFPAAKLEEAATQSTRRHRCDYVGDKTLPFGGPPIRGQWWIAVAGPTACRDKPLLVSHSPQASGDQLNAFSEMYPNFYTL
jgi:hypothetical protein